MYNMIIASYICTALNYVLYCVSRFAKNKKTMLMLDIIAKILTIIGLYLFGSLSGAYSFIISLFAIILARVKENENRKWPILYIILEMLYLIILITKFEGISSVLIFVSSSMTLFSNWFLKPQNMRKVGIMVSVIYLTYQLSIKNYAGL